MYSSQEIVRSSSPSSPVHSHLPELNSVDAKSKPVKTLLKATGGCQVFPRFAVDEMEREPRSAMLATTSHSLVWGWSAGTISSLERDLILLFSIGPIKPTPADKIHFGRLSSLFAHCSSYIRPLSLMDFLMTENGLGFGTCWYNNYSISKKTGWPYPVNQPVQPNSIIIFHEFSKAPTVSESPKSRSRRDSLESQVDSCWQTSLGPSFLFEERVCGISFNGQKHLADRWVDEAIRLHGKDFMVRNLTEGRQDYELDWSDPGLAGK